MQYTVIHIIHTQMNLITVKWAHWDKTQSRELLGLFVCVCIALCTVIAHNTAQNRPDNFPSYPRDNHHCSDDVYLREWGMLSLMMNVLGMLWWWTGEEKLSYGYGGTGKASTDCKFSDYGQPFANDDVITAYLVSCPTSTYHYDHTIVILGLMHVSYLVLSLHLF